MPPAVTQSTLRQKRYYPHLTQANRLILGMEILHGHFFGLMILASASLLGGLIKTNMAVVVALLHGQRRWADRPGLMIFIEKGEVWCSQCDSTVASAIWCHTIICTHTWLLLDVIYD